MQVTMNTVNQNTAFGHFKFSDEAIDYIYKRMRAKDMPKLMKLIDTERENKTVEASIDLLGNRLSGYIRTIDKDGNPINNFCKSLGSQGFFNKLHKGIISFVEHVSNESTKMKESFEKYNLVKDMLK